MSGFNPALPDGSEFTGATPTLKYNGTSFEYERTITTLEVFESAIRSATATSTDIDNQGFSGAQFYLNITSVPGSGSATVALIIQGRDPVSGNYVNMFTSQQVSAGTTLVQLCPAISASANGLATALPRTFRVLAAVSAGATSKDVVFSVGMSFVSP